MTSPHPELLNVTDAVEDSTGKLDVPTCSMCTYYEHIEALDALQRKTSTHVCNRLIDIITGQQKQISCSIMREGGPCGKEGVYYRDFITGDRWRLSKFSEHKKK